jgi:hypothetical protein
MGFIMRAHNTIVFPIGTKVRVDSNYYEESCPWRNEIGIVVEHAINTNTCDTDFVDNYLQFPNGKIEPFANWEISHIVVEMD